MLSKETSMLIYADKNIAEVSAGFSDLGELHLFSPGKIDQQILEKTDVLVVRSVTKVNEQLLAQSKVQFVGSVTAGFNHVDTEFLSRRDIAFSSAPGCNAVSVSQYMTGVLLELSLKGKINLKTGTIGIVGFGCVGKQVDRVARALGLKTLLNDPPLERGAKSAGQPHSFASLDEILDCDAITIHVPYEKKGPDATHDLFNEDRLCRVKKGSVLMNISRGGIVDEKTLLKLLSNGHLGGAVLDTWDNEPNINTNLFPFLDFATPHIAGHSWNGKVNGVRMIRSAICGHFKIKEPPAHYSVSLSTNLSPEETKNWKLMDFVKRTYNVNLDDKTLREAMGKGGAAETPIFESLRQNYRQRPEFSDFTFPAQSTPKELSETLIRLGFKPSSPIISNS